ncbi:MAG: FHA domain-containing protein [Planctomycetes bacterium]|nr:FHA domain-containing protein [Planctomycetota bacterium]
MVNLLVRFEGVEEKFHFLDDVVTLGRVSTNTIQVKDAKASRNHCELRRAGDSWKLVDLESSNGTAVNGNKVNTYLLKPGDIVSIGQFQVVFEPELATGPKLPAKKVEAEIEKTVVDTSEPKKGAAPEAPAMAATVAASRKNLVALGTKAAIAAAVLIGVLVLVNKVRSAGAAEKEQRDRLASALQKSQNGDLEDALAALETLIVSNPDPAIQKKAQSERASVQERIAARDAARAGKRDAAIAELLARQQSASASTRFENSSAQVLAYLANGDFASAVDESKRFMMEFPEGEWHSKMAGSLKQTLARASTAWEELQDRANALTQSEKYAEATVLLAEAQDRFSGTRFTYEIRTKIAAINRLSGVSAAYASGVVEISAQAQESMLAVGDLVKARQYEAALKAFDRMLSGVPEKDRGSLAARRADIEKQRGIFAKLVGTINSGGLKDYAIDLGGGVRGWLSQASDLGVTIEFKDQTGKGGTTGRKWFQVPGAEMLAYFRQLQLDENERLGLASFCYDNRLPLEAADILSEIAKSQGMQGDVFALIARVRGMGVPSDGFVYFERGWFTRTEYTYAKLDYKAKKGAALIAKIEPKPTAEGYAVYREMIDDAELTPEFKATVKGYYVAALKQKRTGIMKGLQNSQSIANYRALQDLKKELNRKRAEALRIIYDKEIYPDENHGVQGQPKVDDAVALVREMWDKPLKVVARLDVGIQVLVEAGQQTNAWLQEMGEEASEEELAEYELLLSNINDSLNLKNICLDSNEKSIREYNKLVWKYNEDAGTQMVGVEVECARITNEYREMMGRRILELDDLLGKCAKKHSQEMVDLNYFAHESPTESLRTPGDRAKAEGYTGPCGENIATGYGSALAAFTGWYNSSGHHRNMLSDMWNHIGLGCVGGAMWTENLGKGTSHVGGRDDVKKKESGGSRRGGIGGGEEPKPEKKPGDTGKKPEEKKDEVAGKTPESPYKKPDGKCTGEAPYSEEPGAMKDPAKKPEEKKD